MISHKICWKSDAAASGFATDGGFPRQMRAISELFDETRVVVPYDAAGTPAGASPLEGRNLRVAPLSLPAGAGLRRKLAMPRWLARNARLIWREISAADAVHTPIPGDVGTIGMLGALALGKPLFVRHCGNWLVQRTAAEQFWKWSMERFAGGRNVMLATGGSADAPSARNRHIEWIFSTSLTRAEIAASRPRELPADGRLKLIVACRQEPRKGTAVVIDALPAILEKFPRAALEVVGDGSLLESYRRRAEALGLAEKINFRGKVPQAEVVELMKRAHVFCFPTTASEGFPKVVLEALACGLPVATTRVSVLPELIGRGGGLLLDEAAPEALAAAVGAICGDAAGYRALSQAAIATARDFTLEDWRDRIGETLRRAWGVASLSS